MFWNLGQVDKAHETTVEGYQRNPNDSNLATNALTYQCFANDKLASTELTESIIASTPTLGFGRSIAAGLYSTLQVMSSGQCDPLTARQVIRFIQGLLDNPRFVREDQRKAFYLLISRICRP